MKYLNYFFVELDHHSNEILGCPFDIADTILDDQDVLRTFRLHVFNRVLSDALLTVGLKLRFTHLDRNKRQSIFTEETCEQIYDYIYSELAHGVLRDSIALSILMNNMLGKLDCKIYLRDIEILNQ